MEIGIIIIVLIGLYFLVKKTKPKQNTSTPVVHVTKRSRQPIRKPESNNEEADYYRWVSVLKDNKPNIHEFDLFGTKAAILWKESSSEVEVVCLTAFNKGSPTTKKYDYFTFNIKDWYWLGTQPRGCANQVKEHLKGVQENIT
ncbi:MAG: hypothetical protein ACRBB4_15130 [Neptuniibacter sp.]